MSNALVIEIDWNDTIRLADSFIEYYEVWKTVTYQFQAISRSRVKRVREFWSQTEPPPIETNLGFISGFLESNPGNKHVQMKGNHLWIENSTHTHTFHISIWLDFIFGSIEYVKAFWFEYIIVIVVHFRWTLFWGKSWREEWRGVRHRTPILSLYQCVASPLQILCFLVTLIPQSRVVIFAPNISIPQHSCEEPLIEVMFPAVVCLCVCCILCHFSWMSMVHTPLCRQDAQSISKHEVQGQEW